MEKISSPLIIVTGLPGTGKTTLSRKVAAAVNLPLLAKDDIKERLFQHLGWSDKVWSDRLAYATFDIMDDWIEQQMLARHRLMVESNFNHVYATEKFRRWQALYGCRFLQIVCQTDFDVLVQRYLTRGQADRHPGHLDDRPPEELRASLAAQLENREDQPLEIGGEVIAVDTTDFAKVRTDPVIRQVGAFVAANTVA